MKRKIMFIINPVAGIKHKKRIPNLVEKFLDHSQFDHEIIYTEYRGHATELAQKAVAEKYDIVAIAGGDGSVNEAGVGLLGSDVALVVLPYGSGNGLAHHLGYPKSISKVIQLINNNHRNHFDAGRVNELYFFSLVGIGFDAFVAKVFDREKTRGFLTYAWAAIKSLFVFKPFEYKITYDGNIISGKAYIINCCNTSQYGYNIRIAPEAKTDDGILDVVIIRDLKKWRAVILVFQVMFQMTGKEKCMQRFQCRTMKVETDGYTYLQIDGETVNKAKEFEFTVLPAALQMVIE
ncbi:MAG: diacylglycerol kinase family lipid kinase [Chitinophagales bacterium]|nr:diacylglycerol kinase family lipid kinase [Chitinophagales bacterium]MBP9705797.1 diacylglycerol kinase family lipid kinase [Chitinophagales bacterium]